MENTSRQIFRKKERNALRLDGEENRKGEVPQNRKMYWEQTQKRR